MSIEELEDKHLHILACGEDEPKEYAKLSVEFAISVLDELNNVFIYSDSDSSWWYSMKLEDKIDEFKKYLDENRSSNTNSI